MGWSALLEETEWSKEDVDACPWSLVFFLGLFISNGTLLLHYNNRYKPLRTQWMKCEFFNILHFSAFLLQSAQTGPLSAYNRM